MIVTREEATLSRVQGMTAFLENLSRALRQAVPYVLKLSPEGEGF